MFKMPKYLKTIISESNWDALCNQIDKKIKENGKVIGRDLMEEEYGLGEMDDMFKNGESCGMSHVLGESEKVGKRDFIGFVLATLISLNYLRLVFRHNGEVVFPEELGELSRGLFSESLSDEKLDKMGKIVWGFELV